MLTRHYQPHLHHLARYFAVAPSTARCARIFPALALRGYGTRAEALPRAESRRGMLTAPPRPLGLMASSRGKARQLFHGTRVPPAAARCRSAGSPPARPPKGAPRAVGERWRCARRFNIPPDVAALRVPPLGLLAVLRRCAVAFAVSSRGCVVVLRAVASSGRRRLASGHHRSLRFFVGRRLRRRGCGRVVRRVGGGRVRLPF